jgi:hypothetical protein
MTLPEPTPQRQAEAIPGMKLSHHIHGSRNIAKVINLQNRERQTGKTRREKK